MATSVKVSTDTETESSPSGYGTETSGDSSSDTDIDTIVNEYREEASLPTSIQECPMSEAKRPSKATTSVVLMASVVLILSYGLQFVIIDNIRRSTMINAIILNLGICVAVFVLLVLISKQPADKGRGRTDFTFIMPLAPWSHALAMFLNFSLLARALHSAWLEIILWICIGLCLYFSYGMKHSNTSKSVTNKRRNHGASRPMVDTSSSDLLSSTQHRRERPNSLMLSPVPISSIPTDIDGGATNYSTPTFDLTNLSKNSDRRC